MKTSVELIGNEVYYVCKFEISVHEEEGVIGMQWDIDVIYESERNRNMIWNFLSQLEDNFGRRNYEKLFKLTDFMFNGISKELLDFGKRFSRVSRYVFNHCEEANYCDQDYFKFEIELPRLERDECCICLENEPDVSFNPCCHLCLCWECLQKMEDKNTCPLCRETVFIHNLVTNVEPSQKLAYENIKDMRKLFLEENAKRHEIEYGAFFQAKHSYHFIIGFRDGELKDRFFADSEITESQEFERLLLNAVYESI